MKFQHLILTRWNLFGHIPVYENPRVKNPIEWMQHREKIFDEMVLPAMRRQSCKDFIWLLSFSPQTPKALTDKYQNEQIVKIKVIFEPHEAWVPKNYRDFGCPWLVTSRIDNDDFYLPTAIAAIQNHFRKTHEPGLLDIGTLFWDVGKDVIYQDTRQTANSPFISISEDVSEKPPMTVFKKEHSYLLNDYPQDNVHKIRTPLAVAVLHGKNLIARDSIGPAVSEELDKNLRSVFGP